MQFVKVGNVHIVELRDGIWAMTCRAGLGITSDGVSSLVGRQEY